MTTRNRIVRVWNRILQSNSNSLLAKVLHSPLISTNPDSDVAVLTSRPEGMSDAILEYMAAGLPIVATDVGANKELIIDGISGVLVPPNNSVDLTDALKRILNNFSMAMSNKSSAFQKANTQFNAQRRSQVFEDMCSRCNVGSLGDSWFSECHVY